MKCWKCGKDIPGSASVCIYCSASMSRKAPVTEQGRAMRMIYDRFGSEAVFAKRSMLSAALGDLMQNAQRLRGQVDMAMSCGAGSVYLDQLRSSGRPDAAFRLRVKTLLTEDAGLSERVAAELMGYFDEMIGWTGAAQTAERSSPRNEDTTARRRPAPENEIPRPAPDTVRARPEPSTCGRQPGTVVRLQYTYKAGVLELSWPAKLVEFKILISGKEVASGSGSSIRFPIELGFAHNIVLEGVDRNGMRASGFCQFKDESKMPDFLK